MGSIRVLLGSTAMTVYKLGGAAATPLAGVDRQACGAAAAVESAAVAVALCPPADLRVLEGPHIFVVARFAALLCASVLLLAALQVQSELYNLVGGFPSEQQWGCAAWQGLGGKGRKAGGRKAGACKRESRGARGSTKRSSAGPAQSQRGSVKLQLLGPHRLFERYDRPLGHVSRHGFPHVCTRWVGRGRGAAGSVMDRVDRAAACEQWRVMRPCAGLATDAAPSLALPAPVCAARRRQLPLPTLQAASPNASSSFE